MTHQVASAKRTDLWRLVLPGLSASLVGIGLARFAYTPLLPAIITQGWFGAASASYLGAANLVGYLVGAIGGAVLARHCPAAVLLRGAMVCASASLFACAWPASFLWFFVWRLISGIAGGLIMLLAAPAILPHVAPSRRGFVSGAIFAGVGLGVALSGTLVPLLLHESLTQAWLGLGALATILTLAGWRGWSLAPVEIAPPLPTIRNLPVGQLRALYGLYALNAFALVPHMVFLVDYVARGLGQGLDSGSSYWVLYGLGAIVGPLLARHVADRVGHHATLLGTLLLELVFIGLPAVTAAPLALIASSLVIGACTIGIVPVMLGRTREILRHHPAAQPGAWRIATASFAVLQATGAYSMSFLLVRSGGDFRLLFAVGAVVIAVAALLCVTTRD